MKQQLEYLMTYYRLSPARFAEKIGVQRSSISHIISGRNKPSYDFILKLLDTFKEIDAEWLLLNKGTPIKQGTVKQAEIINTTPHIESPAKESKQKSEVYKSKHGSDSEAESKSNTNVNNVESVLLLNNDGTFKVFRNE